MKAKKPIGLIVTLAVLASAGYGGYVYYTKPPKLTFVKAQVTRGSMEAVISATGTFSATRSVAVGSRVSGNVVKMYADYNTPVKKGQLVAEIDPSTFQNTLNQRQAALDSAKTQRLQAEVAIKRADIDVANAETNIANQKAALERAKQAVVELQRKYDLLVLQFDSGIGSQDARDAGKAALVQGELSVASAEAQLKTAQATLESTKAAREVTATQAVTAEAQIKQAEGQLQDAQLQLSFTRIEAPVDGVVIARNMNEGQTVQASTTAPQLYEIAEDLTQMHLDTNIDESDISRVQLGQPATFTVDAFPGQTFRGEVIQIRRAAVNVQNVISYTVVVSVDNSSLRLFPGMTANTRIIVDHVDDTLRIPSAALRFRPPEELKVIGDVGGKGGKGKGGKGGFNKGDFGQGDAKSGDAKQTSENNDAKGTQTVAQADASKGDNRRNNVDANSNGSAPPGENGNGFRRQGKGGGNFEFQGKNFDRAQFQGRGGNGNGGGRGGNNFGRGGAGGARPQVQTVYRLTGKEGEVEAVRVRTGITDGNWIQLLGSPNGSAPVKEGDELVTAVEGLVSQPTNQNKGNNFGGNNNFKGNRGGLPF